MRSRNARGRSHVGWEPLRRFAMIGVALIGEDDERSVRTKRTITSPQETFWSESGKVSDIRSIYLLLRCGRAEPHAVEYRHQRHNAIWLQTPNKAVTHVGCPAQHAATKDAFLSNDADLLGRQPRKTARPAEGGRGETKGSDGEYRCPRSQISMPALRS